MATEVPTLIVQVMKLTSLDRPHQCILCILHHLLEDNVIQGAHQGCVYPTGGGRRGGLFAIHALNTIHSCIVFNA